MCETEEVLSWLLTEVEQKSKDCRGSVKSVVRVLQDDVDFETRYDEDLAVDTVLGLEWFSVEILGLAREAKQRLKESKRQVAAWS